MEELERARFQNWLNDIDARVRYQHEFALAGFRALLLINGGAVIGLLTYIGDQQDKAIAAKLGSAFLWYIWGLVTTTVAYIAAYASQGLFLHAMVYEVSQKIGEIEPHKALKKIKKSQCLGYGCITVAVALTVASLACFVVGSIQAMMALT